MSHLPGPDIQQLLHSWAQAKVQHMTITVVLISNFAAQYGICTVPVLAMIIIIIYYYRAACNADAVL